MVVTKEDYESWKHHEVTKQFFKNLSKAREKIKEAVIMGYYDNDEFAKGKAMGLLEITELDYEGFMEGSND